MDLLKIKIKEFCPHCRKMHGYYVRSEKAETRNALGKRCIYIWKRAICERCGKEIPVPELRAESLKNLHLAQINA